MSLTLKESQKKVDEWIQQFEEGYWPPLSMFASLVEEVGELGREINDLEGYKRKRKSSATALEVEVGDIIFSLICIANYYKIDLERAFWKTLGKYSKRDAQRWTPKSR
jgi:NTP pyrophosphatase (non-canonical NTP hydrolase)